MRRAFITGIHGQDGTYLSELLLEKDYQVFGLVRHSTVARPCMAHPNLTLIDGDMTDQGSLVRALEIAQPDEIYNLAAMSWVGESWNQPQVMLDINGAGTVRLLEAVRQVSPKARLLQASSSEMFGNSTEDQQNETTPLQPRSAYAAAKVYAHNMCSIDRESFGTHVSCAICFNHESPRRGELFVTRKISQAVAAIKTGTVRNKALSTTDGKLHLGNLHARRDWGFAGDYVRAMWLMLQEETPGDYVIGTGVATSVMDFASMAFAHVGLFWKNHVISDKSFCRPNEVHFLRADWRKARDLLGWRPTVDVKTLMAMMVDHDLKLAGGA